MNNNNANLLEIFSSFQGEGLFAGYRHLFIRLGGCHLRCSYCDTPESWKYTKSCRIESPEQRRHFTTLQNPMTVNTISQHTAAHLSHRNHHAISITGGEPLLQLPFLLNLLPDLKQYNIPLYLETSGTKIEAFKQIAPLIDISAIDIKLPTTPGTNGNMEESISAIKTSLTHCSHTIVKLVITEFDSIEIIKEYATALKAFQASINLFIQPVTPFGICTNSPTTEFIQKTKNIMAEEGVASQTLPQFHKIIKCL